MPRPYTVLLAVTGFAALLAGSACSPSPIEGQVVGDCTDGIDNDSDGAIDCADEGCGGSPLCLGDDDDSSPSSDDDDSYGGDDDTDPSTVRVTGSVDPGIEGNGVSTNAVLVEVDNESNSVTTSEQGLWSMRLPRQPSVGLYGTLPDYVDSSLYLNLSIPGQQALSEQKIMFLNSDELNMFGEYMNVEYDPARGQLFVWLQSRSLKPVTDAIGEILADHDGGFSMEGDSPDQTDVMTSEAGLLFLNVAPGDASILVTLADGTPCVVPEPVVVTAGIVTVAFSSCP